jgi:hypothetical protein
VIPLGAIVLDTADPFVIDDPAKLPQGVNLHLHRLELELWGGVPRLLLDFTAYIPGTLEIPPLLVSPASGNTGIRGLKVTIASILAADGESLILSNPAQPLPVPGTMFIIYGTVTGIILLLLALIGGSLWGRRNFGDILERIRSRRLIKLMGKIERRLRNKLLKGGGDYGEVLKTLSMELRSFLGSLSGLNCRAMTAGEFVSFPVPGEQAGKVGTALTGEYLGTLFHQMDRLRFSGEGIEKDAVIGILDGVKLFIDTLAQALPYKGAFGGHT